MIGLSKSVMLLMSVVALVSIACFSAVAPTQGPGNEAATIDPKAVVQTIVASTLSAMTQAVPTQAPTATPVPPTNTPLATPTRITPCDWIHFVADVSVPDGTTFEPGDTFVKTWRLQNRGTCTWTPEYRLVFYSGSQMNGPSSAQLAGNVGPGQYIDVSVTLTAPGANGHYIGYWLLRNPAGNLFGAGDTADKAFWVDIYAKEQLPHGTVAGTICYPSETIPQMTLYFQNDDDEVMQFYIAPGTTHYSFLLPNGLYYAYAWQPDAQLWGGYLRKNGTLKSFSISGGETTTGIKICNWGPNPFAEGQ